MQFITMTTEIGRRVVTNSYEILNRFGNRIVRYDYLRWIHDVKSPSPIELQREN